MRGLIPLMLLFCISPAWSQERHALVIGNTNYVTLPSLLTPKTEAESYAQSFRELQFSVTLLHDLSREAMETSLANFYESIHPGDEVVFVYSGHGWSDEKENFLIPVDGKLENTETEFRTRTISLQNRSNGILDEIEKRKPSLVVAVIDACRDNPISSNGRNIGISRGLAPVVASKGSVVIFSASPGQKALDRLTGETASVGLSVFSRNFVPELTSGLTLEDAFFEARSKTAKMAAQENSDQRPIMFADTIEKNCLKADGPCKGLGTVAIEDDKKGPLPLTIIVDPSGNGHYTDLAAAIADAGQNWIIELKPGTYYFPTNTTKAFEIRGSTERQDVIITADETIELRTNVSLSNVTFAQSVKLSYGVIKMNNVEIAVDRSKAALLVLGGILKSDGLYVNGGTIGIAVSGDLDKDTPNGQSSHYLLNTRITGATGIGLNINADSLPVFAESIEVAENGGGGIRVDGTADLTLIDSRVIDNKGVGIVNFGTLFVLNTLFEGNELVSIQFQTDKPSVVAKSVFRGEKMQFNGGGSLGAARLVANLEE